MEAQPVQQTIGLPRDLPRGEQLAMLRTVKLPNRPGVSGGTLKAVLKGIDDFGRRCFAGYEKLAEAAGKSVRQTKRAIEALKELNLICVDRRPVPNRKGTRNEYVIVWGEVARYARSKVPQIERVTVAPEASLSSATVAPELVDSSAMLSSFKCHPDTDSSATVSHSYPSETTIRNANEAPSTSDVDGARYFFSEDEEAIRAKANRIDRHVRAKTRDDRELVLKVATLWHEGRLAESMIEEVLESYDRKRKEPIRNPRAWLWDTMRNQCLRHGLTFEQLLASTDFPRELLAWPKPQGVC